MLARAREALDTGARDLDEVTRRLASEESAFVEARRALEEERQASILEKVGSWLDDGGQINGIGRFGQWGHGPEPSGEAEQGS